MSEKLKNILAALSSGILLFLAWPPLDYSPLIFVGFIPLLYRVDFISDNYIKRRGLYVFLCAFLAFFSWNFLSTYWIRFASPGGAWAAIILNALLMSTVFACYSGIRNKVGKKQGYIALPVLWMSMDYLHLNWDLAWPWMTLGNAFANKVTWIQWYEYTGVFGGSVWIWIITLSVYGMLHRIQKKKTFTLAAIATLLLLAIPLWWSVNRYSNYQEEGSTSKIAVYQPNYNPYTEKYKIAERDQINTWYEFNSKGLNTDVEMLIMPETFLTEWVWENKINYNSSVNRMKKFMEHYPHLSILSGMSSVRKLDPNIEEIPITANKNPQGQWIETYNSAFLLNKTQEIQIYRKSKLVPGPEMMPFGKYLAPILGEFALDLGGHVGTLGVEKEAKIFESDLGIKIAPVICYESVYSEYVTDYVKKGAEIIAVITNDGWWEDTYGYKQHMAYARLRAIENRRSVARAANTGISCYINQRGDVIKSEGWDKRALIHGELKRNRQMTYYTMNGNYLGRLAVFMTFIFLLQWMVARIKKKSHF